MMSKRARFSREDLTLIHEAGHALLVSLLRIQVKAVRADHHDRLSQDGRRPGGECQLSRRLHLDHSIERLDQLKNLEEGVVASSHYGEAQRRQGWRREAPQLSTPSEYSPSKYMSLGIGKDLVFIMERELGGVKPPSSSDLEEEDRHG
jgi:hypothetical protein